MPSNCRAANVSQGLARDNRSPRDNHINSIYRRHRQVVIGAAATFPPPPVIFCQVEVSHILRLSRSRQSYCNPAQSVIFITTGGVLSCQFHYFNEFFIICTQWRSQGWGRGGAVPPPGAHAKRNGAPSTPRTAPLVRVGDAGGWCCCCKNRRKE
jgi:hypothetical protein